MFVSCPELCERIFSSEGKYPVHLVPEPWTIYLQKRNKKRGLFFMDGEEWWDARRQLNPLLLKHLNLKRMQPVIEKGVESLLQEWSSGPMRDLERRLYTWSTSTMLAILLGDSTEARERLEKVIETVVWHVQQIFVTSAVLSLVNTHQAAADETPEWKEFEFHVDNGLSMVETLVKETLADARGPKGLALDLAHLGTAKEDIVRILTDLLLAAADTTSITASWMLHTLATNPKVQETVLQETRNVCGDKKTTVDDIKHFRYTSGLTKEVMRLYPVAPFLTRIAQESIILGQYNVQPGTLLLMSSYAMGRNPDIFDNPEEVRPERWMRNRKEKDFKKHKMAFATLPFGHGARSCIGRRVAEMQLSLLAARSCQDWRIKSGDPDIKFTMRMIGVPDKPISLVLEKN